MLMTMSGCGSTVTFLLTGKYSVTKSREVNQLTLYSTTGGLIQRAELLAEYTSKRIASMISEWNIGIASALLTAS